MNKREHVLNGLLLGIGLGVILAPHGDLTTLRTIVAVTVPVTLGALVPDIDTAFGSHRKTFHNLLVLAGFVAFPLVFDNLRFVWLGVLTHYVLDVAGTTRGIALFYPFGREYDLPIGIPVTSRFALVVTLCITVVEIVLVTGLLQLTATIDVPALSVLSALF
jgi:hypothetical protein